MLVTAILFLCLCFQMPILLASLKRCPWQATKHCGKVKNVSYQHVLLYTPCFKRAFFNPLPHIPTFNDPEKWSLLMTSIFSPFPAMFSAHPKTTMFNPFPNKPWFLRVCRKSLLKTLWEKQTLLVTSNFSFSHSVFYLFGGLPAIFIKFKIVVCQLFQFGWVWERVKLHWFCHLQMLSIWTNLKICLLVKSSGHYNSGLYGGCFILYQKINFRHVRSDRIRRKQVQLLILLKWRWLSVTVWEILIEKRGKKSFLINPFLNDKF